MRASKDKPATTVPLDSRGQAANSGNMKSWIARATSYLPRGLMVIAAILLALSSGGDHGYAAGAADDHTASFHTALAPAGDHAAHASHARAAPAERHSPGHSDCCAPHHEAGVACGVLLCCPCDLAGSVGAAGPAELEDVVYRPRIRLSVIQPPRRPVDKPPRLG